MPLIYLGDSEEKTLRNLGIKEEFPASTFEADCGETQFDQTLILLVDLDMNEPHTYRAAVQKPAVDPTDVPGIIAQLDPEAMHIVEGLDIYLGSRKTCLVFHLLDHALTFKKGAEFSIKNDDPEGQFCGPKLIDDKTFMICHKNSTRADLAYMIRVVKDAGGDEVTFIDVDPRIKNNG